MKSCERCKVDHPMVDLWFAVFVSSGGKRGIWLCEECVEAFWKWALEKTA